MNAPDCRRAFRPDAPVVPVGPEGPPTAEDRGLPRRFARVVALGTGTVGRALLARLHERQDPRLQLHLVANSRRRLPVVADAEPATLLAALADGDAHDGSGHLPGLASVLGAMGVRFKLGGGSELVSIAAWIFISLAIVFLAPNTQQIMAKFRPGLGSEMARAPRWATWSPTIGWAIACAIVGGCGVLSLHRVSEFLYYQF